MGVGMANREEIESRMKELDVVGKLLEQVDINKNNLKIACLFLELQETAGYLEFDCYDIFEFGKKYFHWESTQVKTRMLVAKAYARRSFSEGCIYTIPDIDEVALYSFTALDEIRKFPHFDQGIKYLEREYGISHYTSVATLKKIRR